MNHVRNAEIRDIPGILELLVQVDMVHHAIRPDLFNGPATKYTADELASILADPKTPVFVYADEQGRVLGHLFAIFQKHTGGGVMTDVKTLYIDDLCVREEYRGVEPRVANQLFDHAVAFARQNGCYNVTLNVWAGNDRALRFYQRQGMRPQKYGMEMIL